MAVRADDGGARPPPRVPVDRAVGRRVGRGLTRYELRGPHSWGWGERSATSQVDSEVRLKARFRSRRSLVIEG